MSSLDRNRLASTPSAFARELLARLKLRTAGDMSLLTDPLGLTVKEVDSDGFEGVLVRRADTRKGIIAINKQIREEGRKRFAICHEIGHFILPGHGTERCICKPDNIESWRKGTPEHEIEANEFASELLLPYKEIQPLVKSKDLTISLAKTLSREFRTSLTATCLKCVEVSDEKCAIVVSVAGAIKWFRRNDHFRYFIRVNQQLSKQSYAAQLFSARFIEEPFGAVPAEAWLDNDDLPGNARIWEDSIFLPFYNTTLTILTIHRSLSGDR